MSKDAYYFPHFCNARTDRKMRRIRKEVGIEGYGIFFMLLEVLREQEKFKYPLKDVDLLEDDFQISEEKIRAIICNYQLFDIDENEQFYSPKLISFLEPYTKMKEQRKTAGIRSAEARKEKTESQRSFNGCSTVVQQSKVKEIKRDKIKESRVKDKKIFMDVVKLSDEEHRKLIEQFGQSGANDKIENLALYIQSKGDKYKSHYATILNWERMNAKKNPPPPPKPKGRPGVLEDDTILIRRPDY